MKNKSLFLILILFSCSHADNIKDKTFTLNSFHSAVLHEMGSPLKEEPKPFETWKFDQDILLEDGNPYDYEINGDSLFVFDESDRKSYYITESSSNSLLLIRTDPSEKKRYYLHLKRSENL